MNSIERISATLQGKPTDRRAVSLLLPLYGARLTDCKPSKYYTDAAAYARGQSAVRETFQPDVLFGPFAVALEGAAFVSVMTANNETGVIQPLAEVVTLAHERGLPVHTDAVQAGGKIPLNVKELGVDLLSLSAHKFHGPKGVGALYLRAGLSFEPMLLGGGQESGRRSGTENTAGIVGMGAAAAQAARFMEESPENRVLGMRDAFEKLLLDVVPGVTVNGDLSHRLGNTLHLSFDSCDAAGLSDRGAMIGLALLLLVLFHRRSSGRFSC